MLSQCRSILNPDGVLASNSVLCNPSNSVYISGAANTFSHPYVLSANTGSSTPANLIQLQQENTSGAGIANSNQLFLATTGPFSKASRTAEALPAFGRGEPCAPARPPCPAR